MAYKDQIGRSRHEVTTPALLLDLEVARRNIELMTIEISALGTRLRPHAKSHKSVQLARMQIAAGAIGVTCATIWEAMVMARAHIDDVLIANQVVGRDKVSALVALGRNHRIIVSVDDETNIVRLSEAAAAEAVQLGVVIEVDIGMHRAGVRTDEQALRLAEAIQGTEGLAFRGVQGYEGHCMAQADPRMRAQAARTAHKLLTETAARLTSEGHPCEIISTGGTATFRTAAESPGITEVQAGSYVLMDGFHERLLPGVFGAALTVAGTVTSRQGSTVVLDIGRKSVSTDFGAPGLRAHPGAAVRSYAEEHCVVEFPGVPPLSVGDTTEVVPDYAPTAVNLHDVFHVVENDVVTAIWPVNPRGSGPPLQPADWSESVP